MHRRTCLFSLLAVGCGRVVEATERAPSPAPSATSLPYAELRADIARRRAALASEWTAAHDDEARHGVLDAARQELRQAIVDRLFPAWLGTKWAFNGIADAPHAPVGIACGYFVATILEHAGLRLDTRRRFGQATARTIAASLVPASSAHHRIYSVPANVLEQRVKALGDGLYLVGLDVHVGFVVVSAKGVRVVHASYLGTRRVVDEPITACEAIERSRDAGYHVTALLANRGGDDRLPRAWLEDSPIAVAS